MKIDAFQIFHYQIPFIKCFYLKKTPLHSREGLIIRLITTTGKIGYGEIAPLPEFSQESCQEALKQLIDLRTVFLKQTLEEIVPERLANINDWMNKYTLHPSVRFGIETALLNLSANIHEITLAQFLNKNASPEVPINALLQGNITEVIDDSIRMLNDGFLHFKLKVGSENLTKDIEKVTALQDILHNHAQLRLDANNAWGIEDGMSFAKEIDSKRIECIEDPLHDPQQIPFFSKNTNLPIAADETFLKLKENIFQIEGIRAIIIKPTLLGGITRTLYFKRLAEENGLQTIISSAFESGIGILALANISAAINGQHHSAGLDTLKWFAHDTVRDNLNLKRSKINITHTIQDEKSLTQANLSEIK